MPGGHGESEEFPNVTALGYQSTGMMGAALWPADTQALLNEAHLAAWASGASSATRFTAGLQQFLALQPDTEVWLLPGGAIGDVSTLAAHLAAFVPVDEIAPRIDGPAGITDALRSRWPSHFGTVSRFRYVIVHDADRFIDRDETLFGDFADALMGVAAEAEYVSDELLLIQRAVFVGGSRLHHAAQEPRGPLRAWRRDRSGAGGGASPFWAAVTSLEEPPVLAHPVEKLLQGGVL